MSLEGLRSNPCWNTNHPLVTISLDFTAASLGKALSTTGQPWSLYNNFAYFMGSISRGAVFLLLGMKVSQLRAKYKSGVGRKTIIIELLLLQAAGYGVCRTRSGIIWFRPPAEALDEEDLRELYDIMVHPTLNLVGTVSESSYDIADPEGQAAVKFMVARQKNILGGFYEDYKDEIQKLFERLGNPEVADPPEEVRKLL